jgi:hypothetical protein
MTVLIFLMAVLAGTLAGGFLRVRYLGHQLVVDVGPKFKQIQLQLENPDAEMNLVLVRRRADSPHALRTTE